MTTYAIQKHHHCWRLVTVTEAKNKAQAESKFSYIGKVRAVTMDALSKTNCIEYADAKRIATEKGIMTP